jgi:hypothetical protein
VARRIAILGFALVSVPLVCVAPAAAQTAALPEQPPADPQRAEPQTDARHPAERRPAKIEPAWAGPMSQHVWIDAQAGVESVQLNTFNANFDTMSVGLLPSSGVGPTANIGAGLRLVFLTLGLRGRVATFYDNAPTQTVGAWQIWTLDLEAGLRIPLGRIEPHAALAGGYASFGGFGTAVQGLSAGLDVHGIDARLDGGLDYWVAQSVSIGLDGAAGLLAVARPGVSARDLATPKQIGTIDDAKARVLEASGSSVGSTLALTCDVGVHF